jgi:transcriptional regulator with XRE-family HTH domain
MACGDFEAAVVLPRVTVAEAFQRTLESLLKARNLTQTQLAEMAGLDISTISRLIGGSRVDRFDSIEKIRAAFGLRPADLFDEDAALAQLGLQRRDSDDGERSRHTLATNITDQVSLPPPTSKTGGPAVENDPELWAMLSRYWDGLSTEQRLELVGFGNRLRKTAAATDVVPPTAGFRRG